MRATAIRRTGFAAGGLRIGHARPPRERRRLPRDGAARASFSFSFSRRSRWRSASERRRFPRGLVALRRTAVMPNPPSKYKRKVRVSAH